MKENSYQTEERTEKYGLAAKISCHFFTCYKYTNTALCTLLSSHILLLF